MIFEGERLGESLGLQIFWKGVFWGDDPDMLDCCDGKRCRRACLSCAVCKSIFFYLR